jgi:hypothetical protein
VDEDEGPSMMTVTSRVIIAVCWMVLALLGIDYPNRWVVPALLGIDYPNRYWGIGITALVVIGVVLLAEWWRWEQKIK